MPSSSKAAKPKENTPPQRTLLKDNNDKLLPESKLKVALNCAGDWLIGPYIISLEELEMFQDIYTASNLSELRALEKNPGLMAERVLAITFGVPSSHKPRKLAALDPGLLRYREKEIGFNANGKARQHVLSEVREVVFEGKVPTQREWNFMTYSSKKVLSEDEPERIKNKAESNYSSTPTQNAWNDMLARKLEYPFPSEGKWRYNLLNGVKISDCEYFRSAVCAKDRARLRELGITDTSWRNQLLLQHTIVPITRVRDFQ